MISRQTKTILRLQWLLLFSPIFMTSNAFAVPAFLEAWRANYPDSQSSEIDCQLCHQQAVIGGDGWNPYGWLIREWYIEFNRTSIEQAFQQAETANSDQDDLDLSNFEEIQSSLYPGWVNTSTNTIIFKDFSFLTNQAPPFLEEQTEIEMPVQEDQFCFPIKASNEQFFIVCF